MSTIVINGVTIRDGRNIMVCNGRVIVDGKDITPDAKDISISVNGNIDRIEADICQKISVTGDVGSVATQSGDVEVGGNIKGSVQTMSGNVDCSGSVAGNISTMSGKIKCRK